MTKLELLQAGYEDKGQVTCPKCQQTVQKFTNDLGRTVLLNLDTHPERPSWWHSLGCGKDLEKDFQQAYPQAM